jgi:hypothetical protein
MCKSKEGGREQAQTKGKKTHTHFRNYKLQTLQNTTENQD